MRLDPAAIRAGARLERTETISSTNAEALARARRGENGPLWITARTQTAGRGRRGRAWVSRPGNLYATLLLADPSPPDRVAELSFVTALAVHDAVSEVAPGARRRLALKWPNDLLLDQQKLAGILVEGENGDGRLAVAIGIGVNCAHHPAGTAYPATSLAAAEVMVTPERLFTALSRTMLERLTQWQRGDGFATVRSDWLSRAGQVGRDIRLIVGEEEWSGRFDGLDETGRLVLRLRDGSTRTVTAGEVLPAAATSTPRAPTEVASA
jgi:BirA family biotin operon repressor/biotin-[acetyl-CoA-carboxylase] ligase